jgi:hypothetical protein
MEVVPITLSLYNNTILKTSLNIKDAHNKKDKKENINKLDRPLLPNVWSGASLKFTTISRDHELFLHIFKLGWLAKF